MMGTRKSKLAAVAVLTTAVMGGGVGGSAAFASTVPATPAGGNIHIFVGVGGPKATADPILLTGAIGDYGTATTIEKNGKVDPNGNYVMVALRRGGFEVKATALDRAMKKATKRFNPTTCSLFVTASGTATLYKGSGLYKGIMGTAKLTETVAEVMARHPNGTCNTKSTAQPLSEYSFITGSGRVRF